MQSDITAQALTLKMALTQLQAQAAVIRKQQQMQRQAIDLTSSVPKVSAPPQGQGTRVDKSA